MEKPGSKSTKLFNSKDEPDVSVERRRRWKTKTIVGRPISWSSCPDADVIVARAVYVAAVVAAAAVLPLQQLVSFSGFITRNRQCRRNLFRQHLNSRQNQRCTEQAADCAHLAEPSNSSGTWRPPWRKRRRRRRWRWYPMRWPLYSTFRMLPADPNNNYLETKNGFCML